jgi:hypothetical protein
MSAFNESSKRSLENIVRLEPDTKATAERHRQPLDILKIWNINARYMGLRVRLDTDTFRESYTVPGQYTTLQVDEDTIIYLAIASAPGENDYWDFLIDRASEAGQKLQDYDTHRPLMFSPAEGSGYPVEDVENRPGQTDPRTNHLRSRYITARQTPKTLLTLRPSRSGRSAIILQLFKPLKTEKTAI